MLYEYAQLARVYLHAWQITRNDFYRRIAQEMLDYVAREMTDSQGGFYSIQDADSEGIEGKFFVWTPAEIRKVLGEEAQLFIDAYGVTEGGNFEGKNILYFARDTDILAAMHNLSMQEVEARLVATRRKLFEVREGRVKPARDEKVLTAWNGLILAAFAEAARVLTREDYRAIAEGNADFLLRELRGYPERNGSGAQGHPERNIVESKDETQGIADSTTVGPHSLRRARHDVRVPELCVPTAGHGGGGAGSTTERVKGAPHN